MDKNRIYLVRDMVNQRNKGASKENSKIRVLAIERMLEEGHRITAQEIQQRLELQYDMQVTRKTIYDDIYAIDRFIPLDVHNGYGGGFKKRELLEE